ncbi:DNA repair protein RadA [subsurface metagenome]
MNGQKRFICQSCGRVSVRWLGRCPECGEWDSFYGEKTKKTFSSRSSSGTQVSYKSLEEIGEKVQQRYLTGIREFDRTLGEGVVPGSLVLIGGEPGIGKSTLLLEVAGELSSSKFPVLYISGEESAEQTKLRASRLGVNSPYIYVSSETNVEGIAELMEKLKPKSVVIDSIQTIYREDFPSAPGSVTQVRESAVYLMRVAKERGITVFLIGHVTKEGAIAGPRVLEHVVDTVLYFEPERSQEYRILRSVKNRFGPTLEIGIFRMEQNGLREVSDTSRLFLTDSSMNEDIPGSVAVPTMEGTRCFLVEIQALVTASNLAVPRRVVQGVDYNKLCLLLAVLEKRQGLRFYDQDVFINVAGGMRINEPACDLGIALSVVSSLKNLPFSKRTVAVGEVGLGGDIRPVAFMDKRMGEAAKLGFTRCLTSKVRPNEKKIFSGVKTAEFTRIEEILQNEFRGEADG